MVMIVAKAVIIVALALSSAAAAHLPSAVVQVSLAAHNLALAKVIASVPQWQTAVAALASVHLAVARIFSGVSQIAPLPWVKQALVESAPPQSPALPQVHFFSSVSSTAVPLILSPAQAADKALEKSRAKMAFMFL